MRVFRSSKPPLSEPTPIGIAVVEQDGCYLVGPRPAGVPLSGFWEFPGGKVAPGETPRQAAIRECLEETGMPVEVVGEFPAYLHEYDHARVLLHFLMCRPLDLRMAPSAPWRWVSRRELGKLKFPDGNRRFFDTLSIVAPGFA